jgi:transposase
VRRWCEEIKEVFAVGTKTGNKFVRIGRGGRKLAAAVGGGRKSKI